MRLANLTRERVRTRVGRIGGVGWLLVGFVGSALLLFALLY